MCSEIRRNRPGWKKKKHREHERTGGNTHPHTGNLAIRRRTFPRLSDSEEEQRKQIEYVRQGGIETVVVCSVIIAHFVEAGDWRVRHASTKLCDSVNVDP